MGLNIILYSANLISQQTVDIEIIKKGVRATKIYLRQQIKTHRVEAVVVIKYGNYTIAQNKEESSDTDNKECIGVFAASPLTGYGVLLETHKDKRGRIKFGELYEFDGGTCEYTNKLWLATKKSSAKRPTHNIRPR